LLVCNDAEGGDRRKFLRSLLLFDRTILNHTVLLTCLVRSDFILQAMF